jgi:hypothetical protein
VQAETNYQIVESMPRPREAGPRLYQRLTLMFLLLILVGAVAGILIPAGPGWDFANFFDTGRRVAAGQIGDLYNPDSLIAGVQPQGKLGFYGTPISALFYAPLGFFTPSWAMILFKIQNTLAYFAALALLYITNRKFAESSVIGQWRYAALFAGLSLLYQPLWTIYRVGGQTTPTVLLLFVLALTFHTRSRFAASASCMIAAVLIKPAFIFALVLLACASGWRFLKYTAAILGAVGLASILLLGWGIHVEFLRTMARASQTSYPWFYNSSIYVIAENMKLLGESAGQSLLIKLSTVIVKVTSLALCVYLLAKSRATKLPKAAVRHFDFLTAIVFCLLVSQTVWEHYLAALFPMLTYVAASRRHFSRGALGLIAAIFLLAAWQNLIVINFISANFHFSTAPQLVLIGVCKSAPLWLTAIFMWRHHEDVFNSYAAPAW